MALGYDGTIRINTKIDEAGFNSGTKKVEKGLTQSIGRIRESLKKLAIVFGVGFLLEARELAARIKEIFNSFNVYASPFGARLQQLDEAVKKFQSALALALTSALAALVPYIVIVLNWLTRLLTVLAQLISAFFGLQKGLAGVDINAKKSAGSLAAFDKIDVLKKGEEAKPLLPPLNLPDDLLKKVEEFKKKMLAFLQPIIDAFIRLKQHLEPLGKTLWEALKWAWDNILLPLLTWQVQSEIPAWLDLFGAGADVLNAALIALKPVGEWLWKNFLQPLAKWAGEKFIQLLGWLRDRLEDLAKWIQANPEKFQKIVVAIAAIIAIIWVLVQVIGVVSAVILVVMNVMAAWHALMIGVGAVIAFLASPIGLLILALAALVALVLLAIQRYGSLSAALQAWKTELMQLDFIARVWLWEHIVQPVINALMTAGNTIHDFFVGIFNNIQSALKGIVNFMIGLLNGWLANMVAGINALIDAANLAGSLLPGYAPIPPIVPPQIPYLATGAVIPPNSQFLAVLGDQRSGTNIEAPADLIRQIVREEVGNRQISVTFGGSLGELVRQLKPVITQENTRTGPSLISRSTA